MNRPRVYEGNEPYIFISYAHADSDRVMPIISGLQERGYRVWYDAGIEAGTEWPEYIAEHLDGCGNFLAFISEHSLNSHNCRREINFAIELRKEPLVIYLEDVKMSLGMRMQLGSLQAMFRNRHGSLESFLNELCTSQVLIPCREVTSPAREEAPQLTPQNDFAAQQAEMYFQFGKDYYDRFNKDWKLKDEEDFTKAVEWLTKAADLGHAQAQVYLGNCYYYANGHIDHEKAVFWFRKAAEQGFAKGQNNLGSCYRFGKGVEQNDAEALCWFRKAAAQNSATAQFNLGRCYRFGWGAEENWPEAVKWFEKAAEQDHAGAMKHLGDCYSEGEKYGVPLNWKEAAKWYRKGAERGDRDCEYWLGCCYEAGHGVQQDTDEAIRRYKKAAEQSVWWAKEKLSDLAKNQYSKGVEHYGKKEYAEAVTYFRRSADLGNMDAQNYLGVCCKNGWGITKDAAEAAKWFRKAAEQGDQYGQYNLAACYKDGNGVAKDREEARKWFEKAAEQGMIDAQVEMYYFTNGKEAVRWIRMAAERNDANAQWLLGHSYEYGLGVPLSNDEAIKWYRKAAEQGHKDAKECLQELERQRAFFR